MSSAAEDKKITTTSKERNRRLWYYCGLFSGSLLMASGYASRRLFRQPGWPFMHFTASVTGLCVAFASFRWLYNNHKESVYEEEHLDNVAEYSSAENKSIENSNIDEAKDNNETKGTDATDDVETSDVMDNVTTTNTIEVTEITIANNCNEETKEEKESFQDLPFSPSTDSPKLFIEEDMTKSLKLSKEVSFQSPNSSTNVTFCNFTRFQKEKTSVNSSVTKSPYLLHDESHHRFRKSRSSSANNGKHTRRSTWNDNKTFSRQSCNKKIVKSTNSSIETSTEDIFSTATNTPCALNNDTSFYKTPAGKYVFSLAYQSPWTSCGNIPSLSRRHRDTNVGDAFSQSRWVSENDLVASLQRKLPLDTSPVSPSNLSHQRRTPVEESPVSQANKSIQRKSLEESPTHQSNQSIHRRLSVDESPVSQTNRIIQRRMSLQESPEHQANQSFQKRIPVEESPVSQSIQSFQRRFLEESPNHQTNQSIQRRISVEESPVSRTNQSIQRRMYVEESPVSRTNQSIQRRLSVEESPVSRPNQIIQRMSLEESPEHQANLSLHKKLSVEESPVSQAQQRLPRRMSIEESPNSRERQSANTRQLFLLPAESQREMLSIDSPRNRHHSTPARVSETEDLKPQRLSTSLVSLDRSVNDSLVDHLEDSCQGKESMVEEFLSI